MKHTISIANISDKNHEGFRVFLDDIRIMEAWKYTYKNEKKPDRIDVWIHEDAKELAKTLQGVKKSPNYTPERRKKGEQFSHLLRLSTEKGTPLEETLTKVVHQVVDNCTVYDATNA